MFLLRIVLLPPHFHDAVYGTAASDPVFFLGADPVPGTEAVPGADDDPVSSGDPLLPGADEDDPKIKARIRSKNLAMGRRKRST